MSLKANALHRDAAPDVPTAPAPEVEHADAVLATLGYESVRPHRSVPGPFTKSVVILLCVIAVVAGFWLGKPAPRAESTIATSRDLRGTSSVPEVAGRLETQLEPQMGQELGVGAPVEPAAPESPEIVGHETGPSVGEFAVADVRPSPPEPASAAGEARDASLGTLSRDAQVRRSPGSLAEGSTMMALPGDIDLPREPPQAAGAVSPNLVDPAGDDGLKGLTAREEVIEELSWVPGRRLGAEQRPERPPERQPRLVERAELDDARPPTEQFSDEELQALLELDIAAIRRRAAARPVGEATGDDGTQPSRAGREMSPPTVTRSDRRDAPPVAPPKPPPPASVDGRAANPVPADDFRVALRHHEEGNFDAAQQRYRDLIARNGADPEAHNNLGVLYQERGYIDEAIREFRRALAIDPAYVKAHNNLGVALLGASRSDEAAREFELALAGDPENLESLVNLGLALNATGRHAEAIDTLLKALDRAPQHAEAHYNLALVYDGGDASARALEHYRLFLSLGTDRHPTLAASVRRRVDVLASTQLQP